LRSQRRFGARPLRLFACLPVAQDAAVQSYVRQLEQDYDAPSDAAPHPRREDDFNSEQLMHELEEFLREEREGDAE